MRVSEITNARIGDTSLAKPAHITLLGKGGKVRVVPIGDKTKEHLLVFLDEFHQGKLRQDGARPLFYSTGNGNADTLSVDSASRILKKAYLDDKKPSRELVASVMETCCKDFRYRYTQFVVVYESLSDKEDEKPDAEHTMGVAERSLDSYKQAFDKLCER